jgi:hypothetical protein
VVNGRHAWEESFPVVNGRHAWEESFPVVNGRHAWEESFPVVNGRHAWEESFPVVNGRRPRQRARPRLTCWCMGGRLGLGDVTPIMIRQRSRLRLLALLDDQHRHAAARLRPRAGTAPTTTSIWLSSFAVAACLSFFFAPSSHFPSLDFSLPRTSPATSFSISLTLSIIAQELIYQAMNTRSGAKSI